MGKTSKVVQIENTLLISAVMEFLYCLSHIMHERFPRFHIYRPTAVMWLCATFGLCSRFQVIMLGRRQAIFLTPYLILFKIFEFLFVYMIRILVMFFCVCLPGIMENSGNCHGKVMEFYCQISVGTLTVSIRLLFKLIHSSSYWCCITMFTILHNFAPYHW